jgi:hypothetical protein
VLIILILIRYAKKILSGFLRLIRLWTPQPVAAFYVSSTVILGIIRFPSRRKIKSRHPSSLHLVHFYTTMPFRLKSAGATYQRGIQRCLHSQLGCNAEAYIDDVVVKTREDGGLISDLVETFDNLRKFKMKLNPEKSTFGVPSGKLLGYMVFRRGIDSNPEKASAITKMKPPKSLHNVQKLMGCLAALCKFIS